MPDSAGTTQSRPSASPSTSTSTSTSTDTGTDTSTATPSSAPAGTARTLAELAKDPCRALNDKDTARLGVFVDGAETDLKGPSCQWGARGGLVSFTPDTSTDQTKDAKFQHLTPKNVEGRRALLGAFERDERDESVVMIVSVGTRQSFRVMVVPFGEDAPGPDAPTVATDFAEAILTHLR